MKRVVLFIIIVVSIQLFFIACRSSNKQDEEDFQFYYYPNKNVYYDVEKKNFLYSLDGGKTWDSVASVSNEEPVTLGEKIIVYSPDNEVYKDNAAHRKLYNGRLFDISNADTTVAAGPEVTERKVQKKAQVQPQEEEKVAKGIIKFLSKIFGKKDKPKEDK